MSQLEHTFVCCLCNHQKELSFRAGRYRDGRQVCMKCLIRSIDAIVDGPKAMADEAFEKAAKKRNSAERKAKRISRRRAVA